MDILLCLLRLHAYAEEKVEHILKITGCQAAQGERAGGETDAENWREIPGGRVIIAKFSAAFLFPEVHP